MNATACAEATRVSWHLYVLCAIAISLMSILATVLHIRFCGDSWGFVVWDKYLYAMEVLRPLREHAHAAVLDGIHDGDREAEINARRWYGFILEQQ